MTITIERAEWADPDAVSLRAAQRAELDERYGRDDHEPGSPPTADDIAVFLVARRSDGAAVGCGGLRMLGDGAAEIKRMFVHPSARGTGVSTSILRALEAEGRARGLAMLRLETGTLQPDAIRFYEREGYTRIPLFGSYVGSENSVCFERRLIVTDGKGGEEKGAQKGR